VHEGEVQNRGVKWVTIIATLGFPLKVGLHTIARDSPLIICLYGFNLPVPRAPQRPSTYYKPEGLLRKVGLKHFSKNCESTLP
jgi:hypothetical protein